MSFLNTLAVSVPVRLFIGSSSERGLPIARALQEELEATGTCEVDRWDAGMFSASNFTLESLLNQAEKVDFAVLIATPDDATSRGGSTSSTARDNVIFEYGLFLGALGRNRAYILKAGTDLHLPSDLAGLTYLSYTERSDKNVRAGLNGASRSIETRIAQLGRRVAHNLPAGGPLPDSRTTLERELQLICVNAKSQGWLVKRNDDTTLRLINPQGRKMTLSKRVAPEQTRTDLRQFVAELRAAGLRVNNTVRRPLEN